MDLSNRLLKNQSHRLYFAATKSHTLIAVYVKEDFLWSVLKTLLISCTGCFPSSGVMGEGERMLFYLKLKPR